LSATAAYKERQVEERQEGSLHDDKIRVRFGEGTRIMSISPQIENWAGKILVFSESPPSRAQWERARSTDWLAVEKGHSRRAIIFIPERVKFEFRYNFAPFQSFTKKSIHVAFVSSMTLR
jgi:hypothetical protein